MNPTLNVGKSESYGKKIFLLHTISAGKNDHYAHPKKIASQASSTGKPTVRDQTLGGKQHTKKGGSIKLVGHETNDAAAGLVPSDGITYINSPKGFPQKEKI